MDGTTTPSNGKRDGQQFFKEVREMHKNFKTMWRREHEEKGKDELIAELAAYRQENGMLWERVRLMGKVIARMIEEGGDDDVEHYEHFK